MKPEQQPLLLNSLGETVFACGQRIPLETESSPFNLVILLSGRLVSLRETLRDCL